MWISKANQPNKMFTLKVIDDNSGYLRPDIVHLYGGVDMLQQQAFSHLCPEGQCPWVFRTLLYDMASIHGWKVEVRELPREEVRQNRPETEITAR